MQHHYDYDLALLKMAGLIRDAELERAAAAGRPARPSRSARIRHAFKVARPTGLPLRSLRAQRP